jgi:hypothetical protein
VILHVRMNEAVLVDAHQEFWTGSRSDGAPD